MNNPRLGFKTGDAIPKPINFKAYKCPDRQPDMVTLRDFEPVLTPFNTDKLFEATMTELNLPGIQGMKSSLLPMPPAGNQGVSQPKDLSQLGSAVINMDNGINGNMCPGDSGRRA